jgi:ABC-type nickel/cobalt efflux system permease component RcnA
VVAALILAVVLIGAPGASAHPLGNFSVNHLVLVSVLSDRIDLRYVLDQAEIPTFQERGVPASSVLARKVAEARRALTLRVDGRPAPWRVVAAPRLSHPRGQGGLPLTRVEIAGRAEARRPRTVAIRDGTFPGRVGWKAIVAVPGQGTAVRSSAPVSDPTGGLRHYPRDLLQSPADTRRATLAVSAGGGTVTGQHGRGLGGVAPGDGFAGVLERALAGRAALALLLLASFAWGAMHALAPGHGKAMVAAYLVGTRGTARDAVALGLTVTATHTAGVFALGLVTLLLSAYVLPEDLYPWLNLVSGLLVLAVGAAVLRARLRTARGRRHTPAQAHAHGHVHSHAHPHAHEHRHADAHPHSHEHAHAHADTHPDENEHHHAPSERVRTRSLLAMGASAGLVPCPSALVVLLGAIAQHEIALGLLLIVVFSAGLACTLTALGLLVVSARSVASRLPAPGPVLVALPAVSALLIVGLGVALTLKALPRVL